MSNLPLIVSYVGLMQADQSLISRIIECFRDLIQTTKEVLQSLGHLMGTNKRKILNSTLLRTIDNDFFNEHNFGPQIYQP